MTNTNGDEMLKLARKAVARIATAALEATAEAADMERAKLHHASEPPPAPLQVDPQAIRDFTQSPAYEELVASYISGDSVGHFLLQAIDLLRDQVPEMCSQKVSQ